MAILHDFCSDYGHPINMFDLMLFTRAPVPVRSLAKQPKWRARGRLSLRGPHLNHEDPLIKICKCYPELNHKEREELYIKLLYYKEAPFLSFSNREYSRLINTCLNYGGDLLLCTRWYHRDLEKSFPVIKREMEKICSDWRHVANAKTFLRYLGF